LKIIKIILILIIFSLLTGAAEARPRAKKTKYCRISANIARPKQLKAYTGSVPWPKLASDAKQAAEQKKSATVQKNKAVSSRTAVPMLARISKYLKTGKLMANGLPPKVGYVAVSDRSIKLGSLVWIGRTRYIVGDYTNLYVHQLSKDLDCDLTVDIFTTESKQEAKKFGIEIQKIALLKKA